MGHKPISDDTSLSPLKSGKIVDAPKQKKSPPGLLDKLKKTLRK